MDSSPKRTVQVNVKMAPEDFALLKRAADLLWPDAVLTRSAVVLGLSKLGAKRVLKEKGRREGA